MLYMHTRSSKTYIYAKYNVKFLGQSDLIRSFVNQPESKAS